MDAIIVGAGGFGKEIAFLLQQQNEYQWVGFVDDRKSEQSDVLGKPVIGKIADLLQVKTPMAVFLGLRLRRSKKTSMNSYDKTLTCFFQICLPLAH